MESHAGPQIMALAAGAGARGAFWGFFEGVNSREAGALGLPVFAR